jgi:hypothetical protein
MSLVEEVGPGLDGLSQLRALMNSGRKPGILVSLNFDFIEIDSGRAVFAGTPGEHAYNPIATVHVALAVSQSAARIRNPKSPLFTDRRNHFHVIPPCPRSAFCATQWPGIGIRKRPLYLPI